MVSEQVPIAPPSSLLLFPTCPLVLVVIPSPAACTHSPPTHQALGSPAGVPAARTPRGGIKPGTAWQHKTPLEPFWPLDPEVTTWPPEQGRPLASGSLLFSLLSSKDKNKIPIIAFSSSLMLISSWSLTSVPTAYQRIFSQESFPFHSVSVPTLTPTEISPCCIQPPPIRSKQP